MYRLENRIKVTWFIGFELTNQVLGKVRGDGEHLLLYHNAPTE